MSWTKFQFNSADHCRRLLIDEIPLMFDPIEKMFSRWFLGIEFSICLCQNQKNWSPKSFSTVMQLNSHIVHFMFLCVFFFSFIFCLIKQNKKWQIVHRMSFLISKNVDVQMLSSRHSNSPSLFSFFYFLLLFLWWRTNRSERQLLVQLPYHRRLIAISFINANRCRRSKSRTAH